MSHPGSFAQYSIQVRVKGAYAGRLHKLFCAASVTAWDANVMSRPYIHPLIPRTAFLVIWLVLATMLTVACDTTRGAATPEAAALAHVGQMGPPGSGFSRGRDVELHGTYDVAEGMLVLYSIQRADSAQWPPLNLGYVLVEQREDGWYPVEVQFSNEAQPPLVMYQSQPVRDVGETDWIMYGRALSPEVAAVEVRFDTGAPLRDYVTDGTWAVVADGATAACEVRVLNRQQEIVQQIDVTAANTTGAAADAARRCAAEMNEQS